MESVKTFSSCGRLPDSHFACEEILPTDLQLQPVYQGWLFSLDLAKFTWLISASALPCTQCSAPSPTRAPSLGWWRSSSTSGCSPPSSSCRGFSLKNRGRKAQGCTSSSPCAPQWHPTAAAIPPSKYILAVSLAFPQGCHELTVASANSTSYCSYSLMKRKMRTYLWFYCPVFVCPVLVSVYTLSTVLPSIEKLCHNQSYFLLSAIHLDCQFIIKEMLQYEGLSLLLFPAWRQVLVPSVDSDITITDCRYWW